MTDWNEGYVTDLGYIYGYYNHLNPLFAKLAFLKAGIAIPAVKTACELGFGQGISVNIHAATTGIEWFGTDFNPSQVAFAKEMAEKTTSGAKLYDDSFAEFLKNSDLPDFDYIGLHGIWSWISDENRADIVDFIRKKLKVAGILYISYNTMPGWASFAPIRHLMMQHTEVMGAEGQGIVGLINGAVDFTGRLLATGPKYARVNPFVVNSFKKLKQENRNYLAHEYFNKHWKPMHFAEMAEWLEPTKVQFACSANYLDQIDGLFLTPEQQAFLNEIPDVMFRQTVRDYMTNRQFRKDYWVKGARKLSPIEQLETLRQQRVILVADRKDISLKVSGILPEVVMHEELYNPILDALADHKPKTIGQLEQEISNTGIAFYQLLQAIMILASNFGQLMMAQDDAEIASSAQRAEKLNDYLINKARGSSDVNYLASPVTGGGIPVGRLHQLFLLALKHGKTKPAEWASFVSEIISTQEQHFLIEVQGPASSEKKLAEMTAEAISFAEKHLPILQALRIAS
ncbi:MAG: methyltransferase [Chlorobiaceae bacterium]|nr:methyltransferase [Chlorobiaceae bacterium]